MNKLNFISGLALGLMIGASTTYYVLNKKHGERLEEEFMRSEEEIKKYKDDEEELTEEFKDWIDFKRNEFSEEVAAVVHGNISLDTVERLKNLKQTIADSVAEAEVDTIIITKDEYENEDEFDKETLTWYTVDSTLTHDDDQVFEDVDEVIGLEILTLFNSHNDGDPDILYVRNTKLGIDYEICRVNQSYSEAVLGELLGYTADDGMED